MRNPDHLKNLSPQLRARLGAYPELEIDAPIRGVTVERSGRGICEARSTTRLEARGADDEVGPALVGYASTYDQPYNIGGPTPEDGGWGWDEIIASGAAAKSIRERDDVHLFFDHEGLPLASTGNGSLTLSEDSIGLRSDGRVDPLSPWSMEVYSRVRAGQLDRMSFAFQVTRERWEDRDGNEAPWIEAPVRRIVEVKLFDTSVVSFPANPHTSVTAHSVDPDEMSVRDAYDLLATIPGRTISVDEARQILTAI